MQTPGRQSNKSEAGGWGPSRRGFENHRFKEGGKRAAGRGIRQQTGSAHPVSYEVLSVRRSVIHTQLEKIFLGLGPASRCSSPLGSKGNKAEPPVPRVSRPLCLQTEGRPLPPCPHC